MEGMSVSLVTERDEDKALTTLVSAFVDDPVERWMYPESEQYLTHFPEFLAAFGGRAFEAQSVWSLGDCSAVALWLPPGTEPDSERITDVLTRSVDPGKHADVFSALQQMDLAHPEFPHWYLPWLGVHPDWQGRGLGGQLLKHGLEIVDADHLPAYLETPNPRNMSLYERHGFKVTGETHATACPPITFMLRDPQ